MKKHLSKVITLALLLGISAFFVGATTLDAKSLSAGSITTFEVDFDFQIGNKKYSKGKYKLSKRENFVLVLDNLSGKQTKILLGQRSSRAAKEDSISRLSFHRYRDTYFLREIVSPALSAKVGLSKDEKKIRERSRVRIAEVRISGEK